MNARQCDQIVHDLRATGRYDAERMYVAQGVSVVNARRLSDGKEYTLRTLRDVRKMQDDA